MTKVPKEEVLKIATLSRIALARDEIAVMGKQINEVLTYAHRVCDIGADVTLVSSQTINIFRDDVVIPTASEFLMKQAPERVHNYFVVPMVLDISE